MAFPGQMCSTDTRKKKINGFVAPLYSSDIAGLVVGKIQVAGQRVPRLRGGSEMFHMRDNVLGAQSPAGNVAQYLVC